jgi:hypothetical protein
MLQEYESSCMQRLGTLIEQLQPSQTIVADAQASLKEVTHMLGFRQYTYVGGRLFAGHKIMGWHGVERPVTLTNVHPEFREVYSHNRLEQDDPVLKYCYHVLFPRTWSQIYEQRAITSKEQKFIRLSQDFEMRDGLSFPIHGPGSDYGILSFSSPAETSLSTPTLIALTNFLAQRLHVSMRQAFDIHRESQETRLSPREIDILHWFSEGKTASEIRPFSGEAGRLYVEEDLSSICFVV